MKWFLAVVLLVVFAGCRRHAGDMTTREWSRVKSPEGWCEASVVEFDWPSRANTQILLAFDGGRCGAGAVTFDGSHSDLELRWSDATTLEVRYPKQLTPTRNPSGEYIQCFDRKVHVILS